MIHARRTGVIRARRTGRGVALLLVGAALAASVAACGKYGRPRRHPKAPAESALAPTDAPSPTASALLPTHRTTT